MGFGECVGKLFYAKTMPKADIPKRRPGRPKGALGKLAEERKMTVREMCMKEMAAVVRTWVKIRDDEAAPHSARLTASNLIAERAIGRAAQAEPTSADTPDQRLEAIRREIVDPVTKKAPAKGRADA